MSGYKTNDEPQCIEVEISASTGGKVQIVQFKLFNDFHFHYGEKYTIPANWSEAKRDEWVARKREEIKIKLDALAQAEQDALLESSDWYH